ncbi:MAG: hypothetical protein Q7S11_01815 [bacterium]|nr:hypothetical protein [bacterium]
MSKKHLITLCPHEDPECPEVYLDDAADPGKQVVVTDDFGNTIAMSKDQFRVLVKGSKEGKLDI